MQPPTVNGNADHHRQGSDGGGGNGGGARGTHNPNSSERIVHRPARSKNGCLTCRRRKVRCDEQRPRCSHCERLNLQCMWRPGYTPTQWKFVGSDPGRFASSSSGPLATSSTASATATTPTGMASAAAPAAMAVPGTEMRDGTVFHGNAMVLGDQSSWLQSPSGGVDQLFDYASFMWTAGTGTTSDVMPQTSPGERPRMAGNSAGSNDWSNMWPGVDSSSNGFGNQPNGGISSKAGKGDNVRSNTAEVLASVAREQPRDGTMTIQQLQPQGQTQSQGQGPNQNLPFIEDHDLLNYFVHTVVPPILAEVETQKRWSTMRQMLMSMSNASTMVRCAILAFSSLLYYRREAPWMSSTHHHYETAVKELLAATPEEEDSNDEESLMAAPTGLREHLLATLFFLSYVDILEDRVVRAHEHLKRAYNIFQQGNRRGFRPVEIRLLSWIRLLDARAVSAGGEGLFLSDKSEALIVQPSPASVDDAPPTGAGGDTSSNRDIQTGYPSGGAGEGFHTLEEVKDWDIEDVLFQVLYQPGIVFFQKVESFMGRISMIDPWHRSRGTVEDETEVMQIASRIMKDLRQIYEDRPTLMDHAVEGRLAAPHVSASLAIPITRAFRTYLSNYYASKIHLHRVAYKHLPLSREASEALGQIRRLTQLLVDDLETDAALPVSQLWPLLMLGSEEKDPMAREWIREQILRMEKVATNARITASVLEEVQTRQDAGKVRVDIRSIMHTIFDNCFAIM